ncbi:4Fe-4S binding protein [candidate division FCPU426 bacterium]|nr:4Fe-4S binding protein [candidate division FCPU426 bacterium]
MKELVVISGKGGTGKTSVTASLAVLAGNAVIADCDVDAADLHLLLAPALQRRHDFYSGREAVIRSADCTACGVCASLCRYGAIKSAGEDNAGFAVDAAACEGCGVCVRFCPEQAIDFPERLCGEWMVSGTRCGVLVHARLGAAAENSGKLVSTVRREARRLAEAGNHPYIMVDGPPGIGCPVIASVGGATLVLVVTEPTVSGEHDLDRVLSLARHFNIPAAVCVNKWDINPEMTAKIEDEAEKNGVRIAGRIRYDDSVTRAQMREQTVVETKTPAAADIRRVWEKVREIMSALHA